MSEILPEEWRDVMGYEGYYQVSSHGKVKSLDRITITKRNKKQKRKGVILKPGTDRNGYKMVTLSKNAKTKSFAIHILMAYAFLGPCPGKHGTKIGEWQINHKNQNHLDNYSWNLEWLPVENHIKVSLASPKFMENIVRGESHCHAKVTERIVNEIRNDFRAYPDIAKQYGISIAAVTNIIKGRSWKSVPYDEKLKEHQNNIRKEQTTGSNHPGSKLTEFDVWEILLDNRSQYKIAKYYGISQSKVCRIKKGLSYKKVFKKAQEAGIISKAS